MTPTHYRRKKLKSILGKDKYFLYHWTSIEAALNILKDGCIFSKAMLFGKYFHTNPGILKNIKKNDAIAEAENGFIDYVFLGNTNWAKYNNNPVYGNVCFVIKPENILPNKEFFVFPFNTGRSFSTSNERDKISDATTLINALEHKHPCYEVLIRRRIKIDNKSVAKIITYVDCNFIKRHIFEKKWDIPIETIQRLNNMNNEYINITDPLDVTHSKIKYDSNEYIRKDNHIYVKTSFSNCILELNLDESNKLFEKNSGKCVGELILLNKIDQNNI